MKISEPLLWLGPYIQIASEIVPKVKRIHLIRVLHHKKKDLQRIDASIIQRRRGYAVNIYCVAQVISKTTPKIKFKYVPHSKIEILCSLAHEIAHIEHWEHTPEHKDLESRIVIQFMSRLKQEGYTSSEEELANIKTSC